MDTANIDTLLHALRSAISRRGLVAALTGGALTTGIVTIGEDEADANNKKKGKRKRRKNRHKNKNKRRKNRKPETRVDATCPEPADLSIRNPDGNNRFAQTFTAKASGPLVSAELRISKDAGSPGDYILRLSPLDGSGTPTNEVLAEATVANADVPDGTSNVAFSFENPFSVKAGNEYALVLTRTEGTFGWSVRSGDACAGSPFTSPDQTAPFTERGSDFIFTTFVRS